MDHIKSPVTWLRGFITTGFIQSLVFFNIASTYVKILRKVGTIFFFTIANELLLNLLLKYHGWFFSRS